MAKEQKFKKTSVFLSTHEELIEALRKKCEFVGLADSIISGREFTQKIDFSTITCQEDLKKKLAMLSSVGQENQVQDKKKSVQFNLPGDQQGVTSPKANAPAAK